ncbi:MAG TPA: DoxX family protein [Candidatus Dormibacteraeota bacterium]
MLNIALWIVAGLLGVGSLAGGVLKLILPKDKLAASGWRWVEDFSAGVVRTIGTLEVMAAVGLILPAVVGVAPVLVPVAAVGLALLLIGATVTHIRRHEAKVMGVPLALLTLSVFVALGRFGLQPFTV